jgi:hypothetical protein
MPAWKLLVALVIVGGLGLIGWAYYDPFGAPGPLQKWGLNMHGVTPAKTPREALDKFADQIKKREYKYASMYLTGKYAEEFKLGATGGKKLADAIDEMNHNLEVAGINSEKCKYVLGLLMPFPAEFKITKEPEQKEGQTTANAVLEFQIEGQPSSKYVNFSGDVWGVDRDMLMALYPISLNPKVVALWNGKVNLRDDGAGWKIDFELNDAQLQYLRESKIKKLRAEGGNYVRALDNLKYSIKHDSDTKVNVENNLKRQLEEAKSQ